MFLCTLMQTRTYHESYTQQVEKLLDTQLSKSLELEQDLEDLKKRLAAAEERASQAEGGLRQSAMRSLFLYLPLIQYGELLSVFQLQAALFGLILSSLAILPCVSKPRY